MKKTFKITHWKVIPALVIVLFFILGCFYTALIGSELKKESHLYLSEVARQGANQIENKVSDHLENLGTIAGIIEANGNFDQHQIIDLIKPLAEKSAYKRMGIILPDGQALFTDGLAFDLKDRDYFKKAMTGEKAVSDTLRDPYDGEKINVYATPIRNGDQVMGILFASLKTDVYEELLGISTFDGQGYSYVVKANGDAVVESVHPNSVGEFENIFEPLEKADFKSGGSLETLKKTMAQGENGSFTSVYDGRERYVNYEPLSINDWYIVSAVPRGIVDERSTNIGRYSLWFILIVLTVIAILFGVIFFFQNRSKEELKKIAYIDEVTGGNNWRKFKLDTYEILEASPEKEYGIILMDINRFRFVNEDYGHDIGDLLLTRVMEILKIHSGKHETYGRVSGDNFVILYRMTTREMLIERMKTFTHMLNREKSEFGIKEKILCNFGIYEIEDNTENIEKMREKANTARIAAKTEEVLQWFFYSEKFHEAIVMEKEIVNRMEWALENSEFEMYLQPKFDLHTNEYCGAEALVRWNHPEKGLVFPKDFIPAFERNGFITSLDMYMVEEVCKVLKRWQEMKYPEIKISVNISRKNIKNTNFISELLEITDKYSIRRHCLEIEITEYSFFEDIHLMIEAGKKLQAWGFEISMDDFGSGYSSINLLETLPLNTIKLDIEFFSESLEKKRRFILVKSVIDLVKQLGMIVVAEGIETREEVEFLREMNCDIIQGYYYGKPMPVTDFESLVFQTDPLIV